MLACICTDVYYCTIEIDSS